MWFWKLLKSPLVRQFIVAMLMVVVREMTRDRHEHG